MLSAVSRPATTRSTPLCAIAVRDLDVRRRLAPVGTPETAAHERERDRLDPAASGAYHRAPRSRMDPVHRLPSIYFEKLLELA
jgi:hypothetical protein